MKRYWMILSRCGGRDIPNLLGLHRAFDSFADAEAAITGLRENCQTDTVFTVVCVFAEYRVGHSSVRQLAEDFDPEALA
jgi:hypothetical protein